LSGEDLHGLAEEQAALRRVTTLVARGAAPEVVFAAVAEEAGRLLPVDSASMCRYEADGTLTFVAQWGGVVTLGAGIWRVHRADGARCPAGRQCRAMTRGLRQITPASPSSQ
jgi:hypothetical protein